MESADDAVGALERGEAIAIDVGAIDRRPFINTASFGGYTRMLALRDRLQRRIGRWPAHVVAVVRTTFGGRPLELRLDGEARRAWMVFVGNCRHEPSGFAPTWRPRMDDGLLDVRVLTGDRPFARGRLLLSIVSGRLSHSVAYDRRCVERLEVATDQKQLALARDGDAFEGSGSFTVEKLRRGLVGSTRPRGDDSASSATAAAADAGAVYPAPPRVADRYATTWSQEGHETCPAVRAHQGIRQGAG